MNKTRRKDESKQFNHCVDLPFDKPKHDKGNDHFCLGFRNEFSNSIFIE